MLILMLTTQFNAFFSCFNAFFLASQLKKTLRLTNTEVLSSAKHSAMCALGEGESLVWLPTHS